MDKSDVEMVDAEKNAQDVESNVLVSQETDIGKNVRCETEDQLNSGSQQDTNGNVAGDENSSSKAEPQGPSNAKGVADGSISVADGSVTDGAEIQDEDQNKNGNGEENLEGDVALENKKSNTPAAKDDTICGDIQLPDGSMHTIDKGDVTAVHQSEIIINEVNENGNDMMDEQKDPEIQPKNGNDMMDEEKDPQIEANPATAVADGNDCSDELPKEKIEVNATSFVKVPEPAAPKFPGISSTENAEQHSGLASKNFLEVAKMDDDEDWDDDGSPDDQAAFMRELESFYRERVMEFKPPKFYGHPLNCLKLWRLVIRLGGYDRVTGSKLWRQVGVSFNPPKTCTSVSWTFRTIYEKALLEYERQKKQSGELQLPIHPPDYLGVDNEGNGYQASAPGRARRDAASRAMQGWHGQRLAYGEEKNGYDIPKREKNLKSIGSVKHKRQSEMEPPVKAARTETSKQLVTTVVDVGPPADWVKINVLETKDCFEVYALVPGLLREEVRVQSDPAGRLVITGQPEHLDNPWGITAFKKVVSLPARINPLQTSAVVSLHGRLLVRVPFAQ